MTLFQAEALLSLGFPAGFFAGAESAETHVTIKLADALVRLEREGAVARALSDLIMLRLSAELGLRWPHRLAIPGFGDGGGI